MHHLRRRRHCASKLARLEMRRIRRRHLLMHRVGHALHIELYIAGRGRGVGTFSCIVLAMHFMLCLISCFSFSACLYIEVTCREYCAGQKSDRDRILCGSKK